VTAGQVASMFMSANGSMVTAVHCTAACCQCWYGYSYGQCWSIAI